MGSQRVGHNWATELNWLFEKRDDEVEAPVFWSPDVNSRLIGKVPDAEKDWEQKEKVSEDEVAG